MFSEAIKPLLDQGTGENREPGCHVSDSMAYHLNFAKERGKKYLCHSILLILTNLDYLSLRVQLQRVQGPGYTLWFDKVSSRFKCSLPYVETKSFQPWDIDPIATLISEHMLLTLAMKVCDLVIGMSSHVFTGKDQDRFYKRNETSR